jgi:biopolymer transport protein ExbB/TolQ
MEYLGGRFALTVFKRRLWDYRQNRWNFQGLVDSAAREGRPEVTIRAEATNGARVSEDLLARAVVAMNVHVESDLLEKARKAEQLRARGISDADIAITFGVTLQAIRDWARLSGLAKPVLDAVRDGRLSAHAAAELADLPRAEQVQKLEEILASGIKPTARNVRQNVKPEPSGEPRPSGRTVNKLLKVVAEREDLELSPDFILALRWMRGEVSTKKIKGLSAILRELEAPKEKTE